MRWVPSHEKQGSERIAEADRRGNHEADALASAEARRIGPSLHQQERYDARLALLRAVLGAQSTILDVAQRGGPQPQGGNTTDDDWPWLETSTCGRGCGEVPSGICKGVRCAPGGRT